MFFGAKKEQRYLGVDFGTRSIKAVEISLRKNKPYLENYGALVLDTSQEVLDEFNGDYAQLLQRGLKQLLRRMRVQATQANVAIPAYNGLVMMVDFPKMSEDELAKAIQFESRKYIPASLDDVNVSWEIIKDNAETTQQDDTMKVLLVAAPKSEVDYYDQLFDGTNIEVSALELETFAFARLVTHKTKERVLLVDIGAKTTNIILVDGGVVHINRNVDVGGIDLTNTIAERTKISVERAREMKESSKNFFSGPMAVVFPSIEYITAEIQRILSAEQTNTIKEMIFAGGTAHMTGLLEYFSQTFSTPTRLVAPMDVIHSDKKASDGRPIGLDASYAVAAGLAIQAIENKDA